MSSVSCQHFFYIFFNFIQPNLCCLSKKIRLTQKRIYHIIIFFLRQVLFYIFLHIFYAISDIAIISSFLTPQYQSKDLKIVRICAGRHSDPIPTREFDSWISEKSTCRSHKTCFFCVKFLVFIYCILLQCVVKYNKGGILHASYYIEI